VAQPESHRAAGAAGSAGSRGSSSRGSQDGSVQAAGGIGRHHHHPEASPAVTDAQDPQLCMCTSFLQTGSRCCLQHGSALIRKRRCTCQHDQLGSMQPCITCHVIPFSYVNTICTSPLWCCQAEAGPACQGGRRRRPARALPAVSPLCVQFHLPALAGSAMSRSLIQLQCKV
jgi:hypothetical protein